MEGRRSCNYHTAWIIRAATNGNTLGSKRFHDEVAAMLGRRVSGREGGTPPEGVSRFSKRRSL